MIDPIPIVMLVVLLAPPLVARRRGLHAMIILAALSWVIVAALVVVATDYLASHFFPSDGRAYHDTYYVVAHPFYLLGLVAVAAGLALGAWFARPLSRLASLAFWLMHLGIAATFLPQQFLDPTDLPSDTFALAKRLETINQASTIASAVAVAAALFLALLIALGLIRRFRARP